MIVFCLALAISHMSGSALARGIGPAFTPVFNHTHMAIRHRTDARTSKRTTASPRTGKRAAQNSSRKHQEVATNTRSHRSRHQKRDRRPVKHATADRHAYPLNFFMLNAPEFDRSPLPTEVAQQIRADFESGMAGDYPATSLVRAGLVTYHPMHGGIFWRRERVKYIIVHSTETGRPVGATNVIEGWSSGGRRHAGAQYVVDRDGTIYQAVDPDLATVHVNIFKTLPGINNDNSVGIEMMHTGKQNYPEEQRKSVRALVTYLQDRYGVQGENIITHRYAQQGDHTDPVAFDWIAFLSGQRNFRSKAIASRMNELNKEVATSVPDGGQDPTVYMQPHTAISGNSLDPAVYMQPHNAIGAESRVQSGKGSDTAATAANDALQVVQATSAKQNSSAQLRGPIEMDPHTADILNSLKPAGQSESTLKN